MDAIREHAMKVREFMARKPFGYTGISDADLATYSAALTHDSFTGEALDVNICVESYERLEFLGDSVVELIACDHIYHNSDLREGKMTDFKQEIVANRKISERVLSYGMGIDDAMLVGNSYKTGKDVINENMRADCFEALVGAVYLTKGMEEAKRIVGEVLIPKPRM